MPKIYNIAANYHFFDNLLEFIKTQFLKDDNFEIKNIKIFLPNRRSCREFSNILQQNFPYQILPKIKAISDISFEDFSSNNNYSYIENIAKFQNLSKLQYLLFLTKEIANLEIFKSKNNFLESFKIANNLAILFEDIELQGVNFDKLKEIDDSNLAQNKKLTLETLQILHLKVKKSLLQNNIYHGALRQNIIIDSYIDFLSQYDSKNPIIIAGSTGSVMSGKKLIKSLAKNNYVILNSLTKNNILEETNPQYFLNQLLDFIDISPQNVESFNISSKLSDDCRQEFLKFLMLDATTYANSPINFNKELVKKDLEANFSYIEVDDEIKEAKVIAKICEMAHKSDKKLAIITNNNSLIKYIRFELEATKIEFNDTTNKPISNTKFVEFIILILQIYENNFTSSLLLALCKHKYFSKENYQEIILNLELNVLRKAKKNNDINAIIDAAKEYDDIVIFLKNLRQKFKKLDNINNLSNLINVLIDLVEDLSDDSFTNLINKEVCSEELYDLFQDLKTANININNNYSDIIKNIFANISFFYKSNAQANIQILSTIEARLLNFDEVVIASLNDGDFPEIEKSGWLGKKIKQELGINRVNKKIGQSAYDFCNYLSNPKVFITRHLKKDNLDLIASPFLLKLQNLMQKIDVNIDKSAEYIAQIADSDIIKYEEKPIKIKVSKEQLFDKISITDIAKLLNNPYQIYVKKILKLKALKEIDYEPSHAEFGSFVHEVLEKNIGANLNNLEEISQIFTKYFQNNEEKLIWWPKFLNIFENFKEINEIYDNSSNFVEKKVNLTLKNIKIHGIIDRIIIKDDKIEILDYKTGQIPTKNDIITGLQSQLSIAALIIQKNPEFIDNRSISALTYFKLSSFSESVIKTIFKSEDEIQKLIIEAQQGIENIFEYFFNKNHEFSATNDLDIKDYKFLLRQIC